MKTISVGKTLFMSLLRKQRNTTIRQQFFPPNGVTKDASYFSWWLLGHGVLVILVHLDKFELQHMHETSRMFGWVETLLRGSAACDAKLSY